MNRKNERTKPKQVDKFVAELPTKSRLKIQKVQKEIKPEKDKTVEITKKIEIAKKMYIDKTLDDKKLGRKPDEGWKRVDEKRSDGKRSEESQKVVSKKKSGNKRFSAKQSGSKKVDEAKIEKKLCVYKRLGIETEEEPVPASSTSLVESDHAESSSSDNTDSTTDKKIEVDKKVDSSKKVERDIILHRWLDYTNIGTQVPGTKFIAFKAPLKARLLKRIPEEKHFTPKMLLDMEPNLGLIIDLTSYTRFYDKNYFLSHGIDYAKIYCGGKMVPPEDVLLTFYRVVEKFLSLNKPGDLIIGVNCTYGVNRSGYFICRYMIDKLGIEPHDAINRFQKARGHNIGIRAYAEKLLRKPTKPKSPVALYNMATSISNQKALDVYEEGRLPGKTSSKRKTTKSKSRRGVRKTG